MSVTQLAELIRERQPVVALTGAGVSTESGIPDFRSPTGIWARYDPMEYATIDAFKRDPRKVWEFYGLRLRVLADAEPNTAHLALAELERRGLLRALVTQNVDTLHELAGSQDVVEVHGSIRTAVCLVDGIRVPRAEVVRLVDELGAPPCPACGAILKPDVVMFGELLPTREIDRATQLVREARLLLVVGSTLEVWPVAGLPHETLAAGGAVAIVNRGPTAFDSRAALKLDASAGETLQAVVDALCTWRVVGSGFGGSVAALRLAEKGYRVVVLEAGRRWRPEDFPQTNWRLRRFLWLPRLGCRGIQRLTLLDDVLVLSGAGVGGGSLVYANTLVEPLDPFFDDPQWAGLADWREELAPHYRTARRMLGAATVPAETPADVVVREVAGRMGVEDTVRPTDVAVFFGEPGVAVADPYFGGEGPERVGCTHCGGCMTGCRVGAKNTLDRNYLWLAERLGAEIRAEREVRAAAASRRRLGARVRAAGRVDAAAARGRAGRAGRPRRRRARHGTAPAPLARSRGSPRVSATSSARTRRRSSARPRRSRPGSRRGSRSRPRSGRTTRPLSSPCATAQARTPWACSGRSSSTAAAGCRGRSASRRRRSGTRSSSREASPSAAGRSGR